MAQATRKTTEQIPLTQRLKTVLPFVSALLLLIGATVLVLTLQQRYRDSDSWQLQRVRVEGAMRQVKSAEVLAAMQVQAGMTLAALDLRQLHERVAALPWVKSVSLRRVYPGELQVTVVERTPWLRLNQDELIDTDGNPYAPANVAAFGHLALLRSSHGQLEQAVAQFVGGNDQLKPLGLTIVELDLNGRGALMMTLNNKLQLMFGRDDWDGRLQRFMSLYPGLVADGNVPTYIDLRYDTGFAVAWPQTEKMTNSKTAGL
ncbi:FtsQ-type POTRA domain-containing protein [Permianibacter sp. IMCC34836]|uniref:cell division protein FtsQ/DivIB n=1 Tax=Permianibacter fluminis TaxID=2738515 RepID=UPI00155678C0|nr:FtsQ-type POTRA domain-containing protein [Permianibacter fluminis]NQD37017.1 FtsQ-type POTRA domain-containing protein [Permianibacter fluminis]